MLHATVTSGVYSGWWADRASPCLRVTVDQYTDCGATLTGGRLARDLHACGCGHHTTNKYTHPPRPRVQKIRVASELVSMHIAATGMGPLDARGDPEACTTTKDGTAYSLLHQQRERNTKEGQACENTDSCFALATAPKPQDTRRHGSHHVPPPPRRSYPTPTHTSVRRKYSRLKFLSAAGQARVC